VWYANVPQAKMFGISEEKTDRRNTDFHVILIYCSTWSRRTFCLQNKRQAKQTNTKYNIYKYIFYRAPEGEIDLNLNKLKGQRTRQ